MRAETTGTSPLTQTDAIQLSVHQNNTYPHESLLESREDVYLLSSPLCHGRARLLSNNKVFHEGDVHPGMLRLASPGEKVRVFTASPSRALVLSIPGPAFRMIVKAQEHPHLPGQVSYVDPLLRPDFRIQTLCTTLLSATELSSAPRQLFIDGLAQTLLALLLNHHNGDTQQRSSITTGRLSALELRRCMDYAESMTTKRLRLDGWAAVLGLTTPDFVRRFYRTTRQAPYTWFLNSKIDRAKDLLRDPKLSLAHVALDLGFSSQSHFSQAFRRRTGLTPGLWRSQHFAPES